MVENKERFIYFFNFPLPKIDGGVIFYGFQKFMKMFIFLNGFIVIKYLCL